MCQPASFILTKDKVFWGTKSDAHEAIIEEHKLHADGAKGPNIVRVEIVPKDNDFRLPLDEWVYKLDQDKKPKWYDAAECEARARLVLPDWLAAKVVLPGEKIESLSRDLIAVYGDIHYVRGGTIQYVEGGTIQYVRGGTIQYVYGGTIQYVYGGTIQYVEGGTIQYVEGGTIQYVYGGFDLSVLQGPNAILIDRSGPVPICYVGIQQALK